MKITATGGWCLLGLIVASPLLAQVKSAEDWIAEGIAAHDKGDFLVAIEAYESALAVEPDNVVALYEMAVTFAARKDYSRCVAKAKEALERQIPQRLIGPAYVVAGSCLSAGQNSKRALRMFREGLTRAPGDVGLHFNIAVTLAGEGSDQEAIEHLEQVLESAPAYPSAIYLLAELHRRGGRRIPSILLFARTIALAPNGGRAVAAATALWELFESGISVGEKSTINVLVPAADSANAYGPLEVMLSLAAASMHLEEKEKESEVKRRVDALVSFWNMVAELGPPKGHETSTVWAVAARPLMRAEQGEGLETFAYLVAQRAEVAGAAEWLAQNPDRMAQLEGQLSRERGDR